MSGSFLWAQIFDVSMQKLDGAPIWHHCCVDVFTRDSSGVVQLPKHGLMLISCPDAGEGLFPSGRLEQYYSG